MWRVCNPAGHPLPEPCSAFTNWDFRPSYNIPYFPAVFNMSGYGGLVDKYGPAESYEGAARALIFKRNLTLGGGMHPNTLATFRRLMRYNHYQTDPICQKDGYMGHSCAISARGDLGNAKPGSGWIGGGIDSKVITVE